MVFFILLCSSFCENCHKMKFNINMDEDPQWSCNNHATENWQRAFTHFYSNLYFNQPNIIRLQYTDERREMRVLSMFDGIASGI